MISLKNKKKHCSILWIWAIAILLGSCSNNIYEQSIEIKEGTWLATDESIVFNFEISDTNQQYHIFLDINHATSFAYQNVYCLVESYGPTGLVQSQVASLELASKKGKWYGDCDAENCERKIPFIVNTKFQAAGNYKIKIKQHSRVANLSGMNALRLRIQKVEQSS